MAERIITADEARRLREAATPGPWRLSADRESITQTSHVTRDVWSIPRTHDNMSLAAAAPDLAASVEHHAARADRLARVLAVEAGDWREVPPGWEPRGADMWVRGTHPGRPVIQRWHRDGQPTEWLRRGQIDGPRWPTALEAMEAIDAEVSDG